MRHYQKADGLCCRLTLACPNPELSATVSYSISEWEVERSTISLTRKLGDSKAVGVWEGSWNSSTPVAVKLATLGSTATGDFLSEAQILKDIQDRNIIRLYGVCSNVVPACIITEFMTKGNLLDYMRTGKGRSMTHKEVINIASQVASGMYYLELHHYIHRDLCAKNVLVGERNKVKVANFGKAKALKDGNNEYKVPKGEHLPIRWTAPEVLSTQSHTMKSDVWSFGVFLTELVSRGTLPYPGMSDADVSKKINFGYRMPRPSGCPDHLYQTMLSCWNECPLSRPTFEYLHYLDDYVTDADHIYHH